VQEASADVTDSTAPTGSADALDCVVCGQKIELDEQVVVVWSAESRSGAPDVPMAVGLARCQDQIDLEGARTTGPYSMRQALAEILTSSRIRRFGRTR